MQGIPYHDVSYSVFFYRCINFLQVSLDRNSEGENHIRLKYNESVTVFPGFPYFITSSKRTIGSEGQSSQSIRHRLCSVSLLFYLWNKISVYIFDLQWTQREVLWISITPTKSVLFRSKQYPHLQVFPFFRYKHILYNIFIRVHGLNYLSE
jgi:hypothetical protein